MSGGRAVAAEGGGGEEKDKTRTKETSLMKKETMESMNVEKRSLNEDKNEGRNNMNRKTVLTGPRQVCTCLTA